MGGCSLGSVNMGYSVIQKSKLFMGTKMTEKKRMLNILVVVALGLTLALSGCSDSSRGRFATPAGRGRSAGGGRSGGIPPGGRHHNHFRSERRGDQCKGNRHWTFRRLHLRCRPAADGFQHPSHGGVRWTASPLPVMFGPSLEVTLREHGCLSMKSQPLLRLTRMHTPK